MHHGRAAGWTPDRPRARRRRGCGRRRIEPRAPCRRREQRPARQPPSRRRPRQKLGKAWRPSRGDRLPCRSPTTPCTADPEAAYRSTSWPLSTSPRASSDTNACEPPRCGSRIALTSGATIATFTAAITLKATSRGGLTPSVSNDTRRRRAATHLRGRAWIEDLGELDGLFEARELDEHFIVAEAQVLIAAGGEPAEVVRPDDRDAATGPADPLHLGQAGVTTVTRFGRERRTGDYQVSPIVG